MAQDTLVYSEQITNRGKISSDNGNIVSDGSNGQLVVGQLCHNQQTGTVTTLTTGNTITPGVNQSSMRVTAAGAITGVILAVGTKAGQRVTIIHEGAAANTVTFAASGTSNVADGTGDAIAGLTARTFEWNGTTSLWYPCK